LSTLKDILTGSDAGEVAERTTHAAPGPFAGAVHARARNGRVTGAPVTVVGRSMEFRRIEALPRRVLDMKNVPDVTEMFRRPGGTMKLRPIQSAALLEAAMMNGGFFPLSCGVGKTLITLLLPTALDSTNAVLLVPPQLKRQLKREIETVYSRHFHIPLDVITIVAYSELSQAKHADILDQIKPDLIICDEVHAIRYRTSARTKRALRYFKDNPGTRLVALSGTITSRSLNEYAHLIEAALKKSSPLPRGYREVQDWAGALDVKPEYEVAPGALLRFCKDSETPREGFRRRLIESQGVVASSENEVGASLIVKRLSIKVPPSILSTYAKIKKSWSIEDEEFSDALTLARVIKQVACGFYYRWKWPNDEKNYDWLHARALWNKTVREKLKQSRPGLDSPLLLANAAERSFSGKGNGPTWDQGVEAWMLWKLWKNHPEPPTEAIWLDDYLLRDLEKRGRAALGDNEPTIIWYEHVAVGERLAKLTGWPLYDAGTDASASREPIIIASIAVNGTGKNLQRFSNSIFASLPANGTTFEQTVSRTHRPGQLADTVTVGWYGQIPETAETIDKIKADALYQYETTGAPQKVLGAAHISEDEIDI
jgi:hypothetical protein